MKKSILFVVLFFCAGSLMAQKATIAPFDNTLGGKLTQTFKFKADSVWRTIPLPISTEKFFKQDDIDLNKLNIENQRPLLVAVEGYNMPILNLNGNSNMPVVVLEGNSKMPVLGKGMTKAQKTTFVHP